MSVEASIAIEVTRALQLHACVEASIAIEVKWVEASIAVEVT